MLVAILLSIAAIAILFTIVAFVQLWKSIANLTRKD